MFARKDNLRFEHIEMEASFRTQTSMLFWKIGGINVDRYEALLNQILQADRKIREASQTGGTIR